MKVILILMMAILFSCSSTNAKRNPSSSIQNNIDIKKYFVGLGNVMASASAKAELKKLAQLSEDDMGLIETRERYFICRDSGDYFLTPYLPTDSSELFHPYARFEKCILISTDEYKKLN